MQITETVEKRHSFGRVHEVTQIKDEFFTNYNALVKDNELAQSETNDCVVKSFMVALDISYDRAHAFVAKYLRRKNRKGTYTQLWISDMLGRIKNGYVLRLHMTNKKCRWIFDRFMHPSKIKVSAAKDGLTVKTFLRKNREGRFIVIVNHHAFAIVDGVLYGNYYEQVQGLKRPIQYVIKAEPRK
jgi:hypothetical protein